MGQVAIETCANCGRAIGKLETPSVYQGEVVCGECHATLTRGVPVAGSFVCPNCGYVGEAEKVAKGSIVVAIFLLLVMVLPGLIYLVIYDGYVYVCPKCKLKVGDAK